MRIYMDTSALAKPVVGENESLSLRRRDQAEVGEDLRRPCTLAMWRGGARGLDRLNAQAVSVGVGLATGRIWLFS
jgi:hypothetical protein